MSILVMKFMFQEEYQPPLVQLLYYYELLGLARLMHVYNSSTEDQVDRIIYLLMPASHITFSN
jgi:hypothetical protein